MSMGKRKRYTGDEEDAFSRWYRRHLGFGRGAIAAIKRQANKRERRQGRRETWMPPE